MYRCTVCGAQGASKSALKHKVKGCKGKVVSSSFPLLSSSSGSSSSTTSSSSSSGSRGKKRKNTHPRPRFSMALMNRELKSVTNSSQVTFTGRWSANVVRRGAASFGGRRDPQLLRHLSTQLYWYVCNVLGRKAEQEVQAMLVDNRIVIAANLDASINALLEDLRGSSAKAQPARALQALLRAVQNEGDRRAEDVARKFTGLFDGTRTFSDMPNALDVLRNKDADLFQDLDHSDKADCRDKVAGKDHSGRLIFVNAGGDKLHAEQKLVLALIYSGTRARAVIFGKKRPCVGCFLTLLFAVDVLRLNIEFNRHPGGYWGTATRGLLQLLARAKELRTSMADVDVCAWLHTQAAGLTTHQAQHLDREEKRSSLRDEKFSFDEEDSVDADYTGYDTPSDSEPEDEKGAGSDDETETETEGDSDDDVPLAIRFKKRPRLAEDKQPLFSSDSKNPFSLLPSPPPVSTSFTLASVLPPSSASSSSSSSTTLAPSAPLSSLLTVKGDSKEGDSKSPLAFVPDDLADVPSETLKRALAAQGFVRGWASSKGLNCFLHSVLQLSLQRRDPKNVLHKDVEKLRENWNAIGAAEEGEDLDLEDARTREAVEQFARAQNLRIRVWGLNSRTERLYEVCGFGRAQDRVLNVLWYGPHFEPLWPGN